MTLLLIKLLLQKYQWKNQVMFGLFKRKTGSEQFAKDIINAYENLARKVLKEFGNDDMLGTMTMMAFANAEKDWKTKSGKFANDYKIAEIEVINIIEKSSTNVFNKYFKY